MSEWATSFILTMRNVNTTILVVILFALERFILTMRNVNGVFFLFTVK